MKPVRRFFYNRLEGGKSGHSSLFEKSSPVDSKKVEIETLTLDEYITDNAPPTVIIIDVEGGESKVLEGGKNFFNNYSPTVILEIWLGEKGRKYHAEAIKFLTDLGYKSFKLDKLGELELVDHIDFDNMGGFENFVFQKG